MQTHQDTNWMILSQQIQQADMGVPKHWVYTPMFIVILTWKMMIGRQDFWGNIGFFSIQFQASICRSTNQFHRWAQITHIKPVNSIITRTRHRYGTPAMNVVNFPNGKLQWISTPSHVYVSLPICFYSPYFNDSPLTNAIPSSSQIRKTCVSIKKLQNKYNYIIISKVPIQQSTRSLEYPNCPLYCHYIPVIHPLIFPLISP